MGKLEDEAKAAADYARGRTREQVFNPFGVKIHAVPIATVTPLKVTKQPTLNDEILQMLDELAADIRSGTLSPSYLILGFGEDTTRDGQPAEEYSWDSTGLNRRELVGHLMTYVSKLSVDEA